MRDALQELRSGKRFFAAREETKGLWSSARGEAQYTETRALAQGSDPRLASALTVALLLMGGPRTTSAPPI
jgi:hypothetical protein